MATLYANQSVTLAELLDALTGLIRAATLLNAEAVIEWHNQGRPNANEVPTTNSTYVWFRFLEAEVNNESGANRHGLTTVCKFEVNVVTRGFQDKNQSDKKLGRKHLAVRLLLENALFGRMLHAAYDDAIAPEPPQTTYTTIPTPQQEEDRREGALTSVLRILSLATITCEKLPAMDRPRPEAGQVETRIGIGIKTVLRVTLNDIEELV